MEACRWVSLFFSASKTRINTVTFVPMNMDIRYSAFFSVLCTGLLLQFPVLSGITSLPISGNGVRFPMTGSIVNNGLPHGAKSGVEHKKYLRTSNS